MGWAKKGPYRCVYGTLNLETRDEVKEQTSPWEYAYGHIDYGLLIIFAMDDFIILW